VNFGISRELVIDTVGKVLIRPIRPEDEAALTKFFSEVSDDDIRLRFFTERRAFPHAFVAALTQIDYAREMAFVAIDSATKELIGGSRLVLEPDLTRGEFGILVRSDLHGRGLGWQLMSAILDYAQHGGVERIDGLVSAGNTQMLEMARELGFEMRPCKDDVSLREVLWHPAPSTAPRSPAAAAKREQEKAAL
jgi:acetyltransferase